MNLLAVEGISKRFGPRLLFEDLSFGIDKGSKVGLIAKNGEGKSTLLNLLIGQDSPDSGEVITRNGITIGFLSQSHEFNDTDKVLDLFLSADNPLAVSLKTYQNALSKPNDLDLMERAISNMDRTQAWDYQAKVEKLMAVFKLEGIDWNSLIQPLSGGQKKRLALVQLLLKDPDLYLLDEPTNHLDIAMINWLESYFSQDQRSLFVVSHDRYFLDHVCNQFLELNQGRLDRYHGNYEEYLSQKALRMEQEQATVSKAKNLYRKELDWMRRMPKARGTKAKSRIKEFYSTEEVAKRKLKEDQLSLSIKSERLGGKILELHHVSKAFGEKNLIQDFSYVFKKGERIGLAGKNGSGKTTLIRLITGELMPDKGKVILGETVNLAHYAQEGLQVPGDKRIIEVVKEIAEVIPLAKGRKISASQLLERFLFSKNQQYNQVSSLSGGEKKRLYLLQVLMANPNF